MGDAQSTRQVLVNLLSNAIKYSLEGSTIAIRNAEDDEHIGIAVDDEGLGIPAEIIDRIGEPFLRGESPEVRKTEGSGLGLAISKNFVERQGGRLHFAHRPTTGTRATVLFPRSFETL